MKKIVIYVPLFIVIVFIVDYTNGLICNYMVRNAKSGETARVNGLIENRYDIMIMGSSRCVCHYDDKLMSDSLDVSVINAGEKGNGIILMYGRYHMIPKDKKPSVLIYDVEPAFDIIDYENDDKNRRYLAGLKYYYQESGINDIFKRVDRLEPIKMQSQLFRFNSNMFVILRDFVQYTKTEMSCYAPSYEKYKAPIVTETHVTNSNDTIKLYYIEKLIKETKMDGVQLVLVASPKYSAKTTDVYKPVIALCNKYDVPFLDYYLDLHDTRWFCNDMHLNYPGSQVFTNIIIKKIKTTLFNSNEHINSL